MLLSDIIMPDVNGPNLYAQLASMQPQMEVIYMSGYSGEAFSQHSALKPGAHFLQKPFPARTLLAKIAQALGC